MGIEHYVVSFVSLRILKSAEGLIQHLNDLLGLRILELMAKLVVHSCPYRIMHNHSIVELLYVSISHSTRIIGSRFFRCLIRKDVQNPLMLQDDLQLSIPAIKVGSDELIAVQQHTEG